MDTKCDCGAPNSPSGVTKTMFPPIYHFECENGHDRWYRNTHAEYEAFHLRGHKPSSFFAEASKGS